MPRAAPADAAPPASPPSPDAPTGTTAAQITMPQGLPGFPGVTRFALGPLSGDEGGAAARFFRLRAEEPGGPAFVVVPADTGAAGALLDTAALAEARGTAGLDAADEVAVLFVVTTAREPGEGGGGLRLFANRRAPILVDTRRRLGFQVVLARPDYPVREPLLAA